MGGMTTMELRRHGIGLPLAPVLLALRFLVLMILFDSSDDLLDGRSLKDEYSFYVILNCIFSKIRHVVSSFDIKFVISRLTLIYFHYSRMCFLLIVD